MKMKILLLLLLLLTTSGKLMVQEIPDCWCFPDVNKVWDIQYFPDSLWAMDTCKTGNFVSCDSTLITTYEYGGRKDHLYAKQGWYVAWYSNEVIPLSSTTMTMFTWEDISVNYPNIKDGFKSLADTFGNYHLIKQHSDMPDSTFIYPYKIYFDNYVHILSVLSFLNDIDSLVIDYQWISFPANINDKNKSIEIIRLNPNPVYNNLKLEIDNLQRHITSIKLYNIFGNCVYNEEVINNDDSLEYSINTSGLNSGLYFLKVNNTIYKVLVLRQ